MKEGRTPGDPSNGRSGPAIRSESAEPSSSILARPATRPRPGHLAGGAVGGGRWAETGLAPPHQLSTWAVALAAGPCWRGQNSQSAGVAGSLPAPCAHLAARSPSADPRPMDTHTTFPAAPRACSPALPKGTPFTSGRPSRALGARGRGWDPRQAAENQNRPPQARLCPDVLGSDRPGD